MSVNYNTAVLTTRLQDVATAIDAGGSNGVIQLLDSGSNVLSSLSLQRPCATVANGVLTFGGMSLIDPVAARSGEARLARVADSSGTVVISGLTVNDPSGVSDIYLTPTSVIVAGQTVAITSATITGN